MTRVLFIYWSTAFSILLILIILPLSRDGMFLDGIIYAAIAKNLSLGYGTTWHPFYSTTLFPVFYEHPPLALYFQSLFFKLFGQSFIVERLYCFLMALGQFSLIAAYWVKKSKYAWPSIGILLFLWLLIPLNHMYVNNMLESSLTLFTTLATFVLLIPQNQKKFIFTQNLFAAIFISIAFFCNGPTALFPLVVPLLQPILTTQTSFYHGMKKTLYLIVCVVFSVTVFYVLVPAAFINTQHYFSQQLLAAVLGTRDLRFAGWHHFHIILLYIRAYWMASLVGLASLVVFAKITKQSIISYLKSRLGERHFIFFLLLSLISSLPVGISHRQALNYILQSAPFFTLAMMYLCYEPLIFMGDFFKEKRYFYPILKVTSILLLISTLTTVLVLANGFNRHETMIKDIQYLSRYLGKNEVISSSEEVYFSWYTGAYFSRYSMLSILPREGQPYFLALKNEPLPEHYHAVSLPLSYYQLAILD